MDRVGLPTAVITPQTIIATRLRRPDAATIVEPARPRITGHIADRLPSGLAARFELAEQLGVGGEARVYRAIRRPDGREVAVKVFGPGIVPEPLGRRESFADIAASLGIWLGVGPVGSGRHW